MKFNPNVTAKDAAEYGVKSLEWISAPGGLICIDRWGGIGHGHTTEVMTIHYIE